MSVLITGVSGYVGSWCMQLCLEAGHPVVGTVRDPESRKCAFLRDALAGKSDKISAKAQGSLKLEKVDLLSGDAAWEAVFENNPEIAYVMHTASPYFSKEPKDPNDMLTPAIQGTASVARAAVKYKVKHLVVTSSMASIWDPITHGKTYTPTDWSNVEEQTTYGKSKTLAEKAAWDIARGSGTAVSTVHPMFICGPTLYSDPDLVSGFESGILAVKICTGKMSTVPKIMMGISDVRDVARVHVEALGRPDAADKRFIQARPPAWFTTVQAKFAKHAGVRAASTVPSCCFSFLVCCLPEAKGVKKNLDKVIQIDTTQTTEILQMQFTSEDVTVKDMVDDLTKLGLLKR